MKLALVLTNDWELFGDGSGEFFEIQHDPMRALLERVAAEGGVLTIMAEVAQQWAHRELAGRHVWAGAVAAAWEALLQDAVAGGHDVQLHLHPQWLGASYANGGGWTLDCTRWDFSGLPGYEQRALLGRGKRYLEEVVRVGSPDYTCCAFRAGGYCAQGGSGTVESLLAAGFSADSSVVKGLNRPCLYDYRGAHSNRGAWFAHSDDVARAAPQNRGLLEIPVYSDLRYESPILRRLFGWDAYGRPTVEEARWLAENRRVADVRYPPETRPHAASPGRWRWRRTVGGLVRRRVLPLDYDMIPASVFVRVLVRLLETESKTPGAGDAVVPVVAAGHVKTMHSTENVERILRELNRRLGNDLEFWSLSRAAAYWRQRLAGKDSES